MFKSQIVILIGLSFITCDTLAQQLLWKFGTSDRVYSTPAIEQGSVYFGSNDGFFYALDQQSGKLIWKFQTGGKVASSAAVTGNLVIFSSGDGVIYALDRLSGKVVWKFASKGDTQYDLWDYYRSSPVVHHDRVFWGSGDSTVYALRLKDGSDVWRYKTGGVVHATPVVTDSVVYIGSYDGNLYALNDEDGQLLWKFKTVGDTYFPEGEIQRSATLDDGTLFFGSRDFNIYAIDATSGTGHWNMKEHGSWVIASPLVFGGNIYFGTSDSHAFYCMNKTSGEVIWRMALNMRSYDKPAIRDSTVFFGCFNGKLYGVDAGTGAIKWEFQTDGSKENYNEVYDKNDHFRPDFPIYGKDYEVAEKMIHKMGAILSSPVIAGDVIYFGSSDGKLYAVKL